MSLHEYKLTLAKSLIGGYCSRKQPGHVAAAGPVAMTKMHYAKKKRTESKKVSVGVSTALLKEERGRLYGRGGVG